MSELTLEQLSAGIQAQFGAISDDLALLRAQVKQVRDTFLRSLVTDVETVVNTIDTNVDTVNTTTGTINTTTGTINTNVGTVLTIVPTLDRAYDQALTFMAAERFYANLGLIDSSASLPAWLGQTNITFNNWDATDLRFYARGSNTAGSAHIGATAAESRFIHYAGFGGTATAHAPKNADVTKAIIEFRARFVHNVATTWGVGATTDTATPISAGHYIAVKNSGSTTWALSTRDGTTASESTGGTSDTTSFHNFRVEWDSAQVVLFVDDVSTITKTTNRPAEPLMAYPLLSPGSTAQIDIVDYGVRWA